MNILHLTLKRKWFDLIAHGIKIEEYREIKLYWNKILSKKVYDVVRFRNGYAANSPVMTVSLKGITTGLGIVEWGAPERQRVYILLLGKILSIDWHGKQKAKQ